MVDYESWELSSNNEVNNHFLYQSPSEAATSETSKKSHSVILKEDSFQKFPRNLCSNVRLLALKSLAGPTP